jgi:hypothetical protein
MLIWKLVAIWFLFSCLAAPLLGYAMKRAGREDEVREMRHRHGAERCRADAAESDDLKKGVIEPIGMARHAR